MIRVYGLVRVKVQNVSLRSLEVSDISRVRGETRVFGLCRVLGYACGVVGLRGGGLEI